MTTPPLSQPGRRSSWLRKLSYIFGGLVLLLIVAYFVLTSSAFLKGVILPRAGRAVGAEVSVGEASISPFSHVNLRQLTVKTTGSEPLLQVQEINLRYNLRAILGGTLKVDEITVASPVVQIIENPDGTSNLDPLLKKEPKPDKEPSNEPSKPAQIDLKNFTLKNATVRHIKNLKDGGREVIELTGVTVTLDQLKNGQAGKLTTSAALKLTRPTNEVMEAKSTGDIAFTLGEDLMPQNLKLDFEQNVSIAQGSLSELAGLRMVLKGDVTPTEVKFSERFLRGEQVLGEIKLTGPLDLSKKEGHLQLAITSIDRQVLNLVGAPMGLDFGGSTLNCTTDLVLSQGGTVITANAQLNADKFSVTQKGRSTPPVDLHWTCQATVNTATESAQLQTFTFEGTQNQKPLLRAALSKPMPLAWVKNGAGTGDSALDVAVTDFDLAAWKPFVGDAVTAGRFSLQLKLLSEQGGKQLKLEATSTIADLAAQLGTSPLTQAALEVKLTGQVNDFQKVRLSDYRLSLSEKAQPALTVTGSAGYDGTAFDLQTKIEAVVARLLGEGPITPLSLGLVLNGSFTTNKVLDLRQLQLAFAPTPRAPKNELNVTGQLDLADPDITKGRLVAKADTIDLTQIYDTFGEKRSTASSPASTKPVPAPAPTGEVEPEPTKLPLQMIAEANLGHVYLHEIDLQNFQLTAKIDGGKINLDPCQLALNGAPINAKVDLDLGVKGYAYALSLLLDKVPLEPIANTFSPETRGQYQGLILANAQIKGAGVTGASLQKNLGGQAHFTFTNANLQLIGPKIRKIMVPIATLLRVDEITHSPVNWLDAQTQLGAGNINLSRFAVQSDAFEANTAGVIPIAEVLTNSPLNLPVEFALRRSLAEKASLMPPDAPTNAAYVMLPKFVTLKGTLGEPKSDLNELALGGMLLKSGVGIAEKFGAKIDPKATNLIQNVGDLLTGRKQPANTNQASTNQPSTNAPTKINPLDLFKKKK